MGKTVSKRTARYCNAYHPMYGKQVKCEEPHGHTGEHFNSFYLRAWDNTHAPRFAYAR